MVAVCRDETYAAVIVAHLLIAMTMLYSSEDAADPWPVETQMMLTLIARFCSRMRELSDAPPPAVH
jgi:hypothetical protein